MLCGWMNKSCKYNNLHEVSVLISWGKSCPILTKCALINLPKCPTQPTLVQQKSNFEKDIIQVWFFTSIQAHRERRLTICLHSSMEAEPKHFRAIWSEILGTKESANPLLSQHTTRIQKRGQKWCFTFARNLKRERILSRQPTPCSYFLQTQRAMNLNKLKGK